MGGSLKVTSIWRNRPVDRATLYNLVIASLALSMIVVCGIYLFIPPPLESGSETIMPLRLGRELGEREGGRKLGRFGTMMVEMVAQDLPFTIFVPTEAAAERLARSCTRNVDYALNENVKKGGSAANTTRTSADREASISRCLTAVVSRIMSFSTVPKQLKSSAVPEGRETELESLSGYKLYLARDSRRGLVVNNLTFVAADIGQGLLVIHLIDGVLMDSMFEQSVEIEDE
ncbi:hypothetical protein MPTK1_4g11150 [Marchantia polymorpha subsp. ruderalis]|uniref:FAS1 domain-containing protein n=2 Tax=Marchantia polymorpha TaxID=3197 RepID=A0AAF6B8Q1_MARPO|nr:hypothetical protein MARPO_0011s0100 [Marchantia polymorpha]PTQ46421.1 hypothetical protein MARPO_0011s0100 [Marchantia polymorpha]BBN08384.1 hypothetical protein Mp_4g11150 [Marchantia polymorpha subsp. ruderalis]BBN08385.1 hypothetical protein Mp_4g11150 [Marchantia polymorpha subsp. ruderalis]|eukprot:PTQ46420.1 hypothetical protein MARPO_0011s0100 [Marchantia polymorpha]